MLPNKRGNFGEFGGKYVPETLMPALRELEEAYTAARQDRDFQRELSYYLKDGFATLFDFLSRQYRLA